MRAGDCGDGPLERLVFERVDLPTGGTDEVMMVLATRLGRFEASEPLAKVDAVDES